MNLRAENTKSRTRFTLENLPVTRHKCRAPVSRRAFTLIELLVVIAIVGILFALLLGTVSRNKVAANRIGCVNNLKQWAMAGQLYAAENNDFLPHEAAVDGI